MTDQIFELELSDTFISYISELDLTNIQGLTGCCGYGWKCNTDDTSVSDEA